MIVCVPQLNWLVPTRTLNSLTSVQASASRQGLHPTGLQSPHVLGGLCGVFQWPAVLGTLLSLFAVNAVAQPQCSVTLAWDADSSDDIVSYNIYYGPASLIYTNVVQVGDVTQATVNGLCPGDTYYFAITAVDTSGDESGYSAELVYTVPPPLATLQLRVTVTGQAILDATGPAGQSYNVLAAPNLGSWTTLGTMTLGVNGTAEFIDSTSIGQPSRFYRLMGK